MKEFLGHRGSIGGRIPATLFGATLLVNRYRCSRTWYSDLLNLRPRQEDVSTMGTMRALWQLLCGRWSRISAESQHSSHDAWKQCFGKYRFSFLCWCPRCTIDCRYRHWLVAARLDSISNRKLLIYEPKRCLWQISSKGIWYPSYELANRESHSTTDNCGMDSTKASWSYPGASLRRSLSSWIGWCPRDEVVCWRYQWQVHGCYCRP